MGPIIGGGAPGPAIGSVVSTEALHATRRALETTANVPRAEETLVRADVRRIVRF